MWREVLVAVAVGVVAGASALAYDRYAYWRAYAAPRFGAGMLLFAAMNGLAGASGVAAGALLGWEPRAGAWAFNGLVFGLAGQGLIRIEPQRPELRAVETGRSILARAARFVEQFLDAGAERGLQRRLDALDDVQVYDQATYLHGRYIADDASLPKQARTDQRKLLVDALAQLLSDDRMEGRGRLERYCLNLIAARRLHPTVAWTQHAT